MRSLIITAFLVSLATSESNKGVVSDYYSDYLASPPDFGSSDSRQLAPGSSSSYSSSSYSSSYYSSSDYSSTDYWSSYDYSSYSSSYYTDYESSDYESYYSDYQESCEGKLNAAYICINGTDTDSDACEEDCLEVLINSVEEGDCEEEDLDSTEFIQSALNNGWGVSYLEASIAHGKIWGYYEMCYEDEFDEEDWDYAHEDWDMGEECGDHQFEESIEVVECVYDAVYGDDNGGLQFDCYANDMCDTAKFVRNPHCFLEVSSEMDDNVEEIFEAIQYYEGTCHQDVETDCRNAEELKAQEIILVDKGEHCPQGWGFPLSEDHCEKALELITRKGKRDWDEDDFVSIDGIPDPNEGRPQCFWKAKGEHVSKGDVGWIANPNQGCEWNRYDWSGWGAVCIRCGGCFGKCRDCGDGYHEPYDSSIGKKRRYDDDDDENPTAALVLITIFFLFLLSCFAMCIHLYKWHVRHGKSRVSVGDGSNLGTSAQSQPAFEMMTFQQGGISSSSPGMIRTGANGERLRAPSQVGLLAQPPASAGLNWGPGLVQTPQDRQNQLLALSRNEDGEVVLGGGGGGGAAAFAAPNPPTPINVAQQQEFVYAKA
eukprot:CAMPEP_0182508492 /NCGR_PEP_ID=MMETSP1321-20130603/25109_1 /TAXON_ID=91990 /ORGANISM="Bolidomonas sp., Strain RCC1657" /LENGTH=597 /DNA_ID=CAMNT_0024714571 /DNA_START=69 /DNA_END=1859 /DNA_ORIENTATION=+